jgi:general secretion pathway protein G
MGLRTGSGEKGRDGRDCATVVNAVRRKRHKCSLDVVNVVSGSVGPPLLSTPHLVPSTRAKRNSQAFTLVELLVVLAIVALLLGVAAPRYFGSLERSKETVLRDNLFQVRESLDHYYADTGKYPDKLDDLVARHYLRAAPVDPVTGSATTWVVVPPRELDKGGVFDIRSGAAGNGKDGTAYRDW